MLLLLEDLPSIEPITDGIRRHWDIITKAVTPIKSNELVPAESDLMSLARNSQALGVLDEGMLQLSSNNHSLLQLEAGDIFGFNQLSSSWKASLRGSFAVRVSWYSLQAILTAAQQSSAVADAWTKLLVAEAELFYAIAEGCSIKLGVSGEHQAPRITQFEKGAVIIKQNALSDDVFTLIEGKAEAYIDGVKVGEINADEIFGAIAAIAGVPRTASVIASETCTALSLPKSEFLQLLKTRPATVLKLIQDMAKALSGANERVVKRTQISG